MATPKKYVAVQSIGARATRVAYTNVDTGEVVRNNTTLTISKEIISYAINAIRAQDIKFVGIVTNDIQFPDNTITTYETLVHSDTPQIDPCAVYEWPNGLWSTVSFEEFQGGNFNTPVTWVFIMTPDNQSKYEQLLATVRSSTIGKVDDVSYTMDGELTTRSFVSICYELNTTVQDTSVSKILDKFYRKLNATGQLDSQLSQESVVDTFLQRDKAQQLTKSELVPDIMLETIYSYPWYKRSVDKLKDAGYEISKTQQFNVAQVIGLTQHRQDAQTFTTNQTTKMNMRLIHNLSDMGSGKTLQTVQAFYVSQQMTAAATIRTSRMSQMDLHLTVNLNPSIIIMPGMSKQSWLDTFEIFYDVVDNGNSLELTADCGDFTMKSTVMLGMFDIRNEKLHVTHKLDLQQKEHEWVIVDEMHQLLDLPTFSSFARLGLKWKECNAATFVALSGTMSQLTVQQLGRYCRALNINLTKFNTEHTVEADALLAERQEVLAEQWRNYQKEYRATVLDDIETLIVPKNNLTVGEKKLYARYGAIPCRVEGNNFRMVAQDITDIVPNVNIDLFFEVVGASVVTADSQTINDELSENLQRTHESIVVNTETPLSSEELQLLKRIHAISDAKRAYGSSSIAQKIQASILNLNDGLAKNSIYDVINECASSHTRFLRYLQAQDITLLEDLQASAFINVPKLEDTDKFKTLQSILESEPDETYLIVVNDDESMVQLSKALGIEHLKLSALKDSTQFQNLLNEMYNKQPIVVVPQYMLKASIDLVQVNRLVQYQLNNEVSDMIQSQNRIDRIGQKRDTKAIYIATNQLQSALIDLFIETYRNVRVAHRGILELFVDMSKQITVVSGLMGRAFDKLEQKETESDDVPTIIEKISGTTFRPQPEMNQIIGELVQTGVKDECPTVRSNGYLVPEPTNQYDKEAVMVYLPVVRNGQAEWAHVGYLAKTSNLKSAIAQYGQNVPCLVYSNFWELVEPGKLSRSVSVEVQYNAV